MIFLDTNVVSELFRKVPDRNVVDWLVRNDADLALSTVVIAEIAYGIYKLRPDQRSAGFEVRLSEIRLRYADRLFAFTEDAALVYGAVLGAASRDGRPMSAQDCMIAAIAKVNSGRLATRNIRDFERAGIELVDPWSA